VRRSHALASALAGAGLAIAPVAHAADESGLALAEGEGRDRVRSACSACHSLDYIVMNSPFQDKAGWEKTVKKMIDVFGAPITEEDAAAIVAYLERHYGPAH
jgi:cytochrome c5